MLLSSFKDSTSSLPNGKTTSAQPAAGSARATAPKQPKSKSKKNKRSRFWASLRAALIPCAGPSSAHPIEVDTVSNEPASIPLADREKEKSTVAPVSEKLAVPPTDSHTADAPSSTATSTTVAPEPHKPAIAPLVAIPVPPSPPSDPEEIVPPSPKPQLLTQEESGGVTSGSVQAPGSGAAHAHETESDGTSFTEDEEAGKDMDDQEAEDDEERLIMQGGAGIPIGPVSSNHHIRIRRLLTLFDAIRMANQGRCCHRLRPPTLAASA